MKDPARRSVRYRFDEYVLDTERGALLRGEAEIPLRRQSFEVLVYLVENEGRLVTREELLEAAWPGKVVTDASITQCLVDIRAALEDTEHEKIRTLTRRGYRFELPVAREGGEAPAHRLETDEPWARPGGVRIQAPVLAAGLIALGAAWWLGGRNESPSAADELIPGSATVIAALPVENLSPDSTPAGFAVGFQDLLLAELGRHPQIRVLGRWSIDSLGEQMQHPATLREALGADLALTGSLLRDGQGLRLNFQLHDTASGEQVWAESLEQPADAPGLISLQQSLAQRIAREAARAVTGTAPPTDFVATPGTAFPETDSIDAYEHYLAGLVYSRRIESGEHELDILEAGRREFETAIGYDPDWAPPYAALGRMLHFVASSDTVPDAWQESRTLIDRALELDPGYGPALVSLGYLEYRLGRDYPAAETAYRSAQAWGAPMADWGLGILYASLGRLDESLAHYRAAIASDPLNAPIRAQYAGTLACDEQWDRAAGALGEVVEISDDPHRQLRLAHYEIMAGQVERGRQRWARYRDAQPELDGFMHLALGDPEAARAALERWVAFDPLPPLGAAELALQLGEEARALDWLERRANSDPDSLRYLLCESSMRALEGTPRFDAILVQLGFR